MRNIILANNQIYHIYNRGVEKRKIFVNDIDCLRFIHDLFEFNDTDYSAPPNIRFSLRSPASLTARQLEQCFEAQPQNIRNVKNIKRKRKLLVEILAFCLMPNHFHLILRQKVEGGISLFMKKLSGGYAMYFNEKYKRVGSLFQGRFKAIEIDSEPYFLQLSRYIHLNPVELIEPNWKEEGINNWERVNQFLKKYRWSSYLDYIGQNNFPSLTSRESLLEFFDNDTSKCEEFTKEWIIENLEEIHGLILEE